VRVLRFSADSPFRASFAPAYACPAYPRPGYLQPTFPVAAPNPQSPDPVSGAGCKNLLSLSNIQRQTGQHNKRGRVDKEEESAGSRTPHSRSPG
jgi:hypothetical protein